MKKLKYFLLIFSCAYLTFSCNLKLDEKTSENTKPVAKGDLSEIILVMDSAKWRGPLGTEIRNTFSANMPGLPQDEPIFTIRYVQPEGFNSILKNAKNIVFVTSFDDKSRDSKRLKSYFTRESIERIKNDPSLFMYSKKDEFAKGQEVLHLFGKTDKELIDNITKNREKIVEHFHNIEKGRISGSLFKKQEKGIISNLNKKHNFSLKIPAGYQTAIEEENFIWLRLLGQEVDKSIFISYTDYNSKEAFEGDNIIDYRNNVIKKYLFGDPAKPESYVVTETLLPPVHKNVNFNNKFAVESRGLWKTNTSSMGGPFLGYTLVDEELNRLYYIEGFVYSPGKDKRDFIKELEAILWTFKTSSEIKKKKP